MATFILNLSVTSAQAAWYTFKAVAVSSTLFPSSNWTVTTSSTGSGGVYAQLGDVIRSATNLGNLAWFVLQGHGMLDGGTLYYRQLCFQFDSSGAARVTYSPRAGFTGAASTTLTPAATDQQLLWGGGTNAAPTFAALFPGGGAWMQGRFSESDDAFVIFSYATGGGFPTSLLYLDTICPLYTTGGTLIDQDPCVLYAGVGANCGLRTDISSELRGPFGELALGNGTYPLWSRLAGEYRAVLDSSEASQPTQPGNMQSQPSPYYSVPTYPQDTIRYGRRTALSGTSQPGNNGNLNTVGDKGFGTTLRWSGATFANPTLVAVTDVAANGYGVGTVLGVGSWFCPWEIGVSPAL